MGRSHIHHIISNGFYHVNFRSPSKIEILMEGEECNFSLRISKENCLLLQLPINISHTIDTRFVRLFCLSITMTVPLSSDMAL